MAHDNPQSRNEAILMATLDNEQYTEEARSRIEALLLELKEAIESGGSAEGIIDDTTASTTKTYSSSKINELTAAELPSVSASDNGKVLTVSSGAWSAKTTTQSADIKVRYDIISGYIVDLFPTNINTILSLDTAIKNGRIITLSLTINQYPHLFYARTENNQGQPRVFFDCVEREESATKFMRLVPSVPNTWTTISNFEMLYNKTINDPT